MNAKFTLSTVLFILLGASCFVEARHGGGRAQGVSRAAYIHGGGHRGHYVHGGRRWHGRRGVGVGFGPLFVGTGLYNSYYDDDCFYDEDGRLLCYSPWA